MQRSFAEVDGFRKQRKVTRREVFLVEMARVVPWRRMRQYTDLLPPVTPHSPQLGAIPKLRGRPPKAAANTMVPS